MQEHVGDELPNAEVFSQIEVKSEVLHHDVVADALLQHHLYHIYNDIDEEQVASDRGNVFKHTLQGMFCLL